MERPTLAELASRLALVGANLIDYEGTEKERLAAEEANEHIKRAWNVLNRAATK